MPSAEPDPLDPSSAPPLARRVRVSRSRAAAWLRAASGLRSVYFGAVAALMVLTAGDGSVPVAAPLLYGFMLLCHAAAASLVNNAADAQIDAATRLWRPIPARRLSAPHASYGAALLAAGGIACGFALDWRTGVIGLAMLAAAALYSLAARGSPFGFLSYALIGVLLPAGAVLAADATFLDAHLIWLVPLGIFSGAAAFLLYKLPDYELDDLDGSRSLLHWLGIDTAIAMSWVILAGALALGAAAINLSGGNLFWLLGPLLYQILAGLFCLAQLMRTVTEARLRQQRWLIAPSLPILMLCWLGAAAAA